MRKISSKFLIFMYSSEDKVFRKFQEMAGLKVTGELDEATRKKMSQRRCGLPDIQNVRGMFPIQSCLTKSLRDYSFR
ncbi:unnamed protein product [Enterobius vermicularis]|uniref:PG_binding_1 domain-containing protein n=1 Tax=Enterobius vermicularis TaxID=51028 RepID=A0A0N4VAL1_ENTVE|nr:unnamed protein product [Enterobius vermicularis]